MKCYVCSNKDRFVEDENELICETCGSAYSLEYLGCYFGEEDRRHDAEYEPEEWKKRWNPKERN